MRCPTKTRRHQCYGATSYARQNSKSEARNPKQCQMSQIENSKRAGLQAMQFGDLDIRILNLFRTSKFELRISKGKLDHFVNFVVTKKTWRLHDRYSFYFPFLDAGGPVGLHDDFEAKPARGDGLERYSVEPVFLDA